MDMKKNHSVIYLSLLLVALTIFAFSLTGFSEQPDSKVWTAFDKGQYYNKQMVSRQAGIVTFWTYTVVTEDVRKKRLANVSKPEDAKKYRNYDHYMLLNQLDCQKKMIKLNEVVDYDNKGKVLNRIANTNNQWGFIEPGSSTEKLFNAICGAPAKPLQKK